MQTIRAFDCFRLCADGRLAMIILTFTLFVPGTLLRAADAPPAKSWADLAAERDRLAKQIQSLMAASKTDDAMAVVEKFIKTDRQLIEFTAIDADQKKLQELCREEFRHDLNSLVQWYFSRQAWSLATQRQQELADFCATTFGTADYRTIDARNDQMYMARLAALKPEEAGQLVMAHKTDAKIKELYGRRKFSEAIPLAQEVVQIQQRLLGNASSYLVHSLDNLAFLYQAKGDRSKAEPLLLQALEISKKVQGENHPDYAINLYNLACLYQAQGDYARARTLYRQAVEILKKTRR